MHLASPAGTRGFHPTALVESPHVGEGTRVWAYAHILPGARIGRNCNICDHTFIENDVIVGNRVTIKCGVQLWDGLRVEDDVFIGPNATFTNDRFPRSGQHPPEYARTVLKRGASIGANATLAPGIVIGEMAMVGAGAVVTHNAPPHSKLAGNPARIIGYVDALQEESGHEPEPQTTATLGEAIICRMPRAKDLRGSLSFGEIHRHVPFEVKRYFLVFDVASEHIRGEHAHRSLHQFLVCVAGRCHVVTDDGTMRHEVVLDSPAKGVHIPPMVWATEYKFTRDAVLMVLASEFYDPQDYIRDYTEFLALRRKSPAQPR
jgi:acetyltransferase-like isoleucine patch superfamily enzyme/dTDP-4-dehydrorhamnose 3,5-epimerase-like enzyme